MLALLEGADKSTRRHRRAVMEAQYFVDQAALAPTLARTIDVYREALAHLMPALQRSGHHREHDHKRPSRPSGKGH
jgi:hypothetical protein